MSLLGSSGLALLFLPSMMQVMFSWKQPRFSSIQRRSLQLVCALDYLPCRGSFYGSYAFPFGLSEHRGLLPRILQASCSAPLTICGFEFLFFMRSNDFQKYLPLYESYGTVLYYIFNTMLLTLLVFHIYWWFLICSMITKQLKNRGKVGEDIRSGKLSAFSLLVQIREPTRESIWYHRFDWRPFHIRDPVYL